MKKHPHPRSFRRTAALLLLALAPSAQAQTTRTWSATPTNGNMSLGANWVGGTAPANGDIITFSSSTITAVVNDFPSLSLNRINFNSGGAYTISGNAFTLTTILSQANTAFLQTVEANMILSAGSHLFSNANGAQLAVTGDISGAGTLLKGNSGPTTLSGNNSYSGGTQINNGLLKVSGSGTLGGTSGALSLPQSIGSLDLNGTSQVVGNLSGAAGSIIFNNATGTASTLTIGNGNGGGGTFAASIADHTSGTGTMALLKTGTGTITFSGANTYTGDTTVHAGTLKLDLSGSISNSAAIIVGDAGSTGTHLDVTTKTGGLTIGLAQTLKGIGQIDGNTTILGTHAPGNSPGLQTFNGNLAYSTGSMLNWELAANVSTDTSGVRGAFFDAMDVLSPGTLSIAAGVTSNLIFNGAGSAVDWNNVFWDSSHSWQVYSDANLPTLSSAAIFDTIGISTDSLGATLSGGSFTWNAVGNDVFLNFTVSGVPEPVSLGALTALGLLGVGTLRRRRHAGV